MGIYVHLKKQNVVNVIVTNACMYNLVLKTTYNICILVILFVCITICTMHFALYLYVIMMLDILV